MVEQRARCAGGWERGGVITVADHAYVGPEGHARRRIDEMLTEAGWVVQDYRAINRSAARGVAVREFPLRSGHGTVDYLLFVDGAAVVFFETVGAVEKGA